MSHGTVVGHRAFVLSQRRPRGLSHRKRADGGRKAAEARWDLGAIRCSLQQQPQGPLLLLQPRFSAASPSLILLQPGSLLTFPHICPAYSRLPQYSHDLLLAYI